MCQRGNMKFTRVIGFMFARLLLIAPFVFVLIMTEVDLDNIDIYLEAGLGAQLLWGILFLLAGLLLSDYLVARILKMNKFLDQKKDNILLFCSLYTWVLGFSFFVYIFTTMHTSYSKWKGGVSDVNTVLEKLNSKEIEETQRELNISIKAAKDSQNPRVLDYTLKRKTQFEETIERLKE